MVKTQVPTESVPRTDSNPTNENWSLIPAVMLTAWGFFMLAVAVINKHRFESLEIGTIALSIIFGFLLIFRVASASIVSSYVKGVAWVMTVIIMATLIYWLTGIQAKFLIALFLWNPLTLALATLIFLSGIVALLLRKRP
ncbi:MAG TPA: hypothetical protein VJ841_00295 [Candidatus Saccharimonadales bacterium]|nr:hypothetical protein [Candidatus Saccharimonadales bacterium]